MTDKEVGELWHKANLPVIFDLIRKLVEERTRSYMHTGDRRRDLSHDAAIWQALSDFGIREQDWQSEAP